MGTGHQASLVELCCAFPCWTTCDVPVFPPQKRPLPRPGPGRRSWWQLPDLQTSGLAYRVWVHTECTAPPGLVGAPGREADSGHARLGAACTLSICGLSGSLRPGPSPPWQLNQGSRGGHSWCLPAQPGRLLGGAVTVRPRALASCCSMCRWRLRPRPGLAVCRATETQLRRRPSARQP